jgi:hypothetical protein
MNDSRAKESPRHPWRVALGIFCTLLLIFGATIQVAHIHTPAEVSHAGCALCATAHVVISPAVPATAPFPVRPAATQLIEVKPKFTRRALIFSLYTRPPPVAIAFA